MTPPCIRDTGPQPFPVSPLEGVSYFFKLDFLCSAARIATILSLQSAPLVPQWKIYMFGP